MEVILYVWSALKDLFLTNVMCVKVNVHNCSLTVHLLNDKL